MTNNLLTIKMHNTLNRLQPKNLCGPFDAQFSRKFRGKKSHSLSVQLLKLAKTPTLNILSTLQTARSQPSILPKLKEIEKLAKADRRKPQKVNKYVDGVSDLELYIAKKLANNLSTQQIVSKIVQNSSQGFENRKIMTQNYLRMTSVNAEEQKFLQPGSYTPEPTNPEARFTKTEYSAIKKWVSDKQFAQKFDKFIIKKHEQQPPGAQQVQQTDLNEQQVVQQIRSDKQTVTKIARAMIAEQADLLQEEEPQQSEHSMQEESRVREDRGIGWIIKECHEFQKRFKVRKAKLRGKK